jgi:4-alpha-glucanotransferase
MSNFHIVFTPSTSLEEAVDRAVAEWGIEPEYWDIFGRHHPATTEVKRNILQSMGVDASSRESIDCALEERLWREWSRPLPLTTVRGERDPLEVEVRLPEGLRNDSIRLRLCWEDGTCETMDFNPIDLLQVGAAELRGQRFVAWRVPLAASPRLGYHTLVIQPVIDGPFEAAQCHFILCPDRAFCPEQYLSNHRRAAGITVSLFGVRSERNWGCGDTTDLRALLDWVAPEVQASFLGLNPLHAIHNRTPYNTSPYLPNCIFYRNFIYIDPQQTVEYRECAPAQRLFVSDAFQARLRRLREAEFVEYEQVARVKLKFLKLLFRGFLQTWREGGERARRFQEWAAGEGELLDRFATYSALDEVLHKRDRNLWLWTDWPVEYREPESVEVRAFAAKHWRLVLFYKWLQWLLDLQFAEVQRYAQEAGLPIGLYHDLALATDRFGSDLWAGRRFFVHGCRVGSPPDDFSPNGQDWSFPPPDLEAHRADGFRHFAESIRKTSRHGGALRIDHVMRFFRLFWIPEGLTPADGAYVRAEPGELLRILALESVRQKVMVVGEDLGTVEPSFRAALAQFGILSYRLLYFEKHADGRFRLPHEYPGNALVSATTHDLPTIAGFWTGRDIEARRQAGTIDEAGYRAQKQDRSREKQKLLDTLFALNLMPSWFARSADSVPELTGELHYAIIGFLAMTPSMLLALNQEDLTKETEQQNLPGTTAEYPNWRRKMKYSVEQLSVSKEALDCAAMFRHWLARTNRAPQVGVAPVTGSVRI